MMLPWRRLDSKVYIVIRRVHIAGSWGLSLLITPAVMPLILRIARVEKKLTLQK